MLREISQEDLNTILAALRFYQEKGQDEPANRSDAIHDIATNMDQQTSMDADGIDKLCEWLNTGERPSDRIAIMWCIEDVRHIREDLSDDQCRKVLEQADRRHDAEAGINWDVLRCHADMLFPEDEENTPTECKDCGSRFDGGVEVDTVCPACKRGMVTKQEA